LGVVYNKYQDSLLILLGVKFFTHILNTKKLSNSAETLIPIIIAFITPYDRLLTTQRKRKIRNCFGFRHFRFLKKMTKQYAIVPNGS
jgi:hypothetical protein